VTPPSLTTDRDVVRVLEQSAAVALLQRAASSLRAAAGSSRLRRFADQVRAAVGPRIGVVLMAAVVSHVVLTGAAARPRGVYWLLVPALVAVIAAVLLAAGPPRVEARD
jgi:hypothetical protein